MIYTLTLAPAIDLYVDIANYKIGEVNRSSSTTLIAGGKGINVSRLLKKLNRDSICLGYVGGATGSFIIDELKKEKIKSDFIKTESLTRINVKFKTTAFNAPTPEIKKNEMLALNKSLSLLKKDDILIISGRIPDIFLNSQFDKTLSSLKKKGVLFIIDTSGPFLIKALKYQPFLLKPNQEELGELFHTSINDINSATKYAKRAVDLGAKNVLVSLGDKGALLVNKNEEHFLKALKGKVVNTVGCGDSLVAGFIDEYLKSKDYKKALVNGVACGTAMAFYHNGLNYDKIKKIKALLVHD